MRQALATDLDGTLIPLAGNQDNVRHLETLKEHINRSNVEFLFVTGRHFESVENAMEIHHLPVPGWIICDVGTTIMHRSQDGTFSSMEPYRNELASLTRSLPLESLQNLLNDLTGLRKQEEEKQGEFKLSYYCDQTDRIEITQKIQQRLDESSAPYSLISSVDPFNADGLIDLLPKTVSKAYAIEWWRQHAKLNRENVVFAGDSGNDTAALTAGYRSIVVGNAGESVVEEVKRINEERGHTEKLFVADAPATSGVLRGCEYFGLFPA